MVKVRLWGSLQPLANYQEEVIVNATTVRELLDAVAHTYPALAPQIKRGVSLAIDGLIYREAWFIEIKPESEVVLMPYMVGG